METARMILRKLLHPPKAILYLLPPPVFAALIFIFATDQNRSGLAYPIYSMSAYSLVILLAAVPGAIKKLRARLWSSERMQRVASTGIAGRYLSDLRFRGELSIWQGLAVNILYAVFRTITGICYRSVWFLSMAAYYFVLAGMRGYLIWCNRRRESLGQSYGYRCYRKIALLLFLLNIPMGGMIVLMVRTDSGFFYPGHVIYLSALYTFYTMILSVVNIRKYRKIGSPILSAARVLNVVCAMMSVLGLQTAMISRFSTSGDGYRMLMNAITGGAVYGVVVVIAICMVVRTALSKKEATPREQI